MSQPLCKIIEREDNTQDLVHWVQHVCTARSRKQTSRQRVRKKSKKQDCPVILTKQGIASRSSYFQAFPLSLDSKDFFTMRHSQWSHGWCLRLLALLNPLQRTMTVATTIIFYSVFSKDLRCLSAILLRSKQHKISNGQNCRRTLKCLFKN